jgi:hypothetical protein
MTDRRWLLILLVSAGLATADEEKTMPPAMMVRVTAEWFAMSGETCSKLLEMDRSGGDAALREEVRALVTRGEANLLDLASGITRPGLPIRVSSVQELVHPTEYDPDDNKFQTGPQDGEPGPQPQPQSFNTFPTGLIPPAYETKELGSLLEADLVLKRDGKTIEATISNSWSVLAGWNSFGKYKDAQTEVDLRLPRIITLRFLSQFLFTDGVPMLVSVVSPSAPDGTTDPTRKMLVFLRVDALRLPE